MNSVDGFLAMGGYGAFVWPAYGLAVLVLGGLAAYSWRRYRASVAMVDRLRQQSGRSR
jgi:heme exporter protein D